jgi:hypothetical protein
LAERIRRVLRVRHPDRAVAVDVDIGLAVGASGLRVRLRHFDPDQIRLSNCRSVRLAGRAGNNRRASVEGATPSCNRRTFSFGSPRIDYSILRAASGCSSTGGYMRHIAACAFLGAIGLTSANAGPSSFQRSCADIIVEGVQTGAHLKATCGDGKGKSVPATLELFAIANIDGKLTRQASGPSTFQQTCTGYHVESDRRRAMLVADCKRRDQTISHTKLEIEDVKNIFGELRYR